MKLFWFELTKVFCKKGFLIVFALLVALSGFLLYRNAQTASPVPPEAVRHLYRDLSGMSDTQKGAYLTNGKSEMDAFTQIKMNQQAAGDPALAALSSDDAKLEQYLKLYEKGGYLKYTTSLFSESSLYSSALSEYARVAGYSQYLDSIRQKASDMNGISIFSKPDSFSFRNIAKTAQDFKPLDGRKLTLDLSDGINTATGFAFTDFVALLLIFYVCLLLVMFEKEKGLFSLTYPTRRGRWPLFRSKLLAVAFSCLLIEAALYAVNFAVAGALYGFGDLTRAVQSVQGYNGCVLRLNVLQYLLLLLATKYIAFVLTGFLFVSICMAAKNGMTVYIACAALFGGEYALFLTIPSYSALNFFKVINLISFISAAPLYRDYLNLNILNHPVNVMPVAGITAALLLIASLTACLILSRRHKIAFPIRSFAWPFRKRKDRRRALSLRLFSHEAYKLFISGRAWILIAALILFAGYSYSRYTFMTTEDDTYYAAYMQRLEGVPSPEKAQYIAAEQKRFDDLSKQLSDASQSYANGRLSKNDYMSLSFVIAQSTAGRNAFERVRSQYSYVTAAKGNLSMVNLLGYEKVFGIDSDGRDILNVLLLLLVLTGLFSSVFSAEHATGAIRLISTCVRGRRDTLRCKLLLSLLLTVPVFALCYAPDLLHICRFYGLTQLFAPAASLQFLPTLPHGMSILLALAALYGARLFAAFVCVVLILFISQALKSTYAAMAVSLGLFVLPLLLHLIGFSLVDRLSLNSLFIGSAIFSGDIPAIAARLAVICAVTLCAFALTNIGFCRYRPFHANR